MNPKTNNFETDHLKFIEFSLSEAFKDLFAEILQNKQENQNLRQETENIKAELAELKKEKTFARKTSKKTKFKPRQ